MNWLQTIRSFLPQQIPGPMAVLYEKAAVPCLARMHAQVASEVASSLTRGRVLDVGTGPGRLLVEIAQRAPALELVGVDLSRRMLRIARRTTARRANAASGRPIRLVRADVADLPFDDNSFDLVVSTLSLHHWHDAAKGLRECLRVTAPGGRCWVYDLRTDVSSRTHARALSGKALTRWVMGRVFRFHGVDPRRFSPDCIAGLLPRATVRTDVREAHMRLEIRKGHAKPEPEAACPALQGERARLVIGSAGHAG